MQNDSGFTFLFPDDITETDIADAMDFVRKNEDTILCTVIAKSGSAEYWVDVHYYWYNYMQHGIDLEFYNTEGKCQHTHWLGSSHAIKSAANYRSLCNRIRRETVRFFDKYKMEGLDKNQTLCI